MVRIRSSSTRESEVSELKSSSLSSTVPASFGVSWVRESQEGGRKENEEGSEVADEIYGSNLLECWALPDTRMVHIMFHLKNRFGRRNLTRH